MATVKVTKAVKINIPKILNKVENDNFGTFLAQRWKALISPYTPRREGLLEDTAIIRPFEIEYIQPYSHYMYNGVVYEDPLLHVSGIYDASKDAWFSRKNVQKVPRQTASEGRSITFNYLRDFSGKFSSFKSDGPSIRTSNKSSWEVIGGIKNGGKYRF